MSRATMIEIDGDKLEQAINSRGMNMAFAATELGYNNNYFSHCKCRGLVPRSAVVGLQSRFGIAFEEYKKPEPEPEPEIIPALQEVPDDRPIINIVPVDYDRIAEIIAGAIDYQKLCATIISALKKVREE